jgi:nitrite reductase (NADH) small subunit
VAPRSRTRGETWQPVCPLVTLPVERGVTALLHGTSVAVFRSFEDRVYALANHDPYDRVAPLARGIVGMRGDVPFVASPQHRHAFDLRTGVCLDDPGVSVASYPVRVVDGTVLVGPRAPH